MIGLDDGAFFDQDMVVDVKLWTRSLVLSYLTESVFSAGSLLQYCPNIENFARRSTGTTGGDNKSGSWIDPPD